MSKLETYFTSYAPAEVLGRMKEKELNKSKNRMTLEEKMEKAEQKRQERIEKKK